MAGEIKQHWIAAQNNKDRFVLFCDAIFAIAITLLILQIDVPEIVYESNLDDVLWELWPRFVSFGISFFVIARFWLVHLNIFSHVRHLDVRLVSTSLFFMALIVFLPFTTDFYGAHNENFFIDRFHLVLKDMKMLAYFSFLHRFIIIIYLGLEPIYFITNIGTINNRSIPPTTTVTITQVRIRITLL